MEKKNFNVLVSVVTFFLGGLYIVADTPSLNANVIGYVDSPYSVASALGVVLIIASAAFFVLAVQHHNNDKSLEAFVRGVENQREKIGDQYVGEDLKERYGHHLDHKSGTDNKEQSH